MVDLSVNDKYKPEEYSYFKTLSKLGADGWVLLELGSSLVDGMRRIERSFGFHTCMKEVCNRSKLISGLNVVSLGYELVYVVTTTPKQILTSAYDLICCRNRIDSIASLLGEIATVCGAIKFFHKIQAINMGHIIDGVNVTKYSTGLVACVLRIYSAHQWIHGGKPKDDSRLAKTAFEARLSAKRASYWSDGSLGLLYAALLAGKRVKVSPYIFVALGVASTATFIFSHFQNARADHEEAQYAYSKIAPAA